MLSCSVVLYNSSYRMIKRQIDEFLKFDRGDKFYLIDNSEKDELRSLGNLPKVEYIYMAKNIGFGAGHNVAFRKSMKESKYHLIINPDVEYKADILTKSIDYMEKEGKVGILTPKSYLETGEIQYQCKLLPTPFIFFGRRFLGSRFYKTSTNRRFEMRHSDYNTTMRVPFMSGCFKFFRVSLLEKIGLFDEKIFMFCEDIDINRRAWDKCSTIFFPETTIIHHHERKTFRNLKIFKIYLQATIYYFNKWGWFFDKDRKRINKEALKESRYFDTE